MNKEHLSLVCKHRHMFKNGAPPENFGILYCFIYGILLFEKKIQF